MRGDGGGGGCGTSANFGDPTPYLTYEEDTGAVGNYFSSFMGCRSVFPCMQTLLVSYWFFAVPYMFVPGGHKEMSSLSNCAI